MYLVEASQDTPPLYPDDTPRYIAAELYIASPQGQTCHWAMRVAIHGAGNQDFPTKLVAKLETRYRLDASTKRC
jgi:hypothetical protein